MTYRELYEKAERKLEKGEITSGEFDEMTKPLDEEIRPRGEWHTTPNPNHSPFDSTSEVIYMCSKCDYSNGDRIAVVWNFCPNCGADMRKEGDEK